MASDREALVEQIADAIAAADNAVGPETLLTWGEIADAALAAVEAAGWGPPEPVTAEERKAGDEVSDERQTGATIPDDAQAAMQALADHLTQTDPTWAGTMHSMIALYLDGWRVVPPDHRIVPASVLPDAATRADIAALVDLCEALNGFATCEQVRVPAPMIERVRAWLAATEGEP